MKVLFYSSKSYDKQYFNIANKTHTLRFIESALSQETVNLITDEEAICIFVNDLVNATVVELLHQKGIKIIALRCAGFNNVDLVACKKYDIKLVRVPAYSPYAVAEHAVALLQTLNRKIHKAYNRVREGNFSLEHLDGFDLHGKTVGVVGTGHIGQIFSTIMLGFGCNLLAYDPQPIPELISKGVDYVTLNELFSKSDIISLHCPLNEHTHYIINENSLALMKEHVFIINTGRGGHIDTKAIIEYLKNGKIGGLALDVYEQESELFFTDHSSEIIKDEILTRLMTFPNVLITSHQGFFTKEALAQIAQITLQNISDIETNSICKNSLV